MKLTENDILFFKNISQTDAGNYLQDYYKRLEDHAYNSKEWQEGDTKESAAMAARFIREHLIERIRPTKPSGQSAGIYE